MSYESRSHTRRTEELQRQIDEAIVEGWRIESETPDRIVLVKREYGNLGVHVLLAVLTAWWSFGLINVAYAAFKYANDSQRRVLRDSQTCPECGTAVPAGARYCEHCGAELPATTEPPRVTETSEASDAPEA